MRIKVIVNQHELSISCANGQQSFQWLASVVQERLKENKLLRTSMDPESYIVTEIRNTENELINPKDKIYEHATPAGLSVRATISQTFPTDDWENPVFNDWMQVAYLHSASNQNWAKEMESWRQNLEKIKKDSSDIFGLSNDAAKNVDINATLLASKAVPHSARLIKIGFDFTEADVELAFNLDWQIMSWKWLPTPLMELQKNKLGDVIKSSYSLICNIFAHYAGIGKVGQRFGMSVEELGHFLHFMKLFDWKADEELIESFVERTFPDKNSNGTESNRSSKADLKAKGSGKYSDNWLLITRAHFTEILTYTALEQQLGTTPDTAIRAILEGPVNSFWDTITTKYLYYSCPEPSLKKSFQEYYHLLKQVFHLKATIDSKFGPRLSLANFLSIMKEATLVESDNESFGVSCFLQSQLNPVVQFELEHIVFVEFVEALSRLSLKAIESYSVLTDGKRIRMAFNMVTELSSTHAEAK